MILLKIIGLQIFWFMVVLFGKEVSVILPFLAAFFIVTIDFIVVRPKVSIGRYLFLLCFFLIAGCLNDFGLIWLNLISKNSYQLGSLSLWIVFITYYEKIFVKFQKISPGIVSMTGGIAGALTYWSAAKMGAIEITSGRENQFLLSQFVFWAVFFPASLRLYFKGGYWDALLDKSTIFSFDKSGFIRHEKQFNENLSLKDLSGKSVLVTGATSGIGEEVASTLSSLGAKTIVTGRNQEKGLRFEKQNSHSKFVSLDMAKWKELYEFAKTCESLDHVVFNAGSMPEKLIVNDEGVEFQSASQLFGHYYLLVWLKEFKKIKPGARIVWVSSGGMYLKKLNIDSLVKNPNYEKVDTYANVKRAQVTLVEELALKTEWDDYFIYSMHPGWVGTEGLKDALPGFSRLMKNRLRSPSEGADTILWCLLTDNAPESGGFYFDRKKVSPYITKGYSPTLKQREELMKILEASKRS